MSGPHSVGGGGSGRHFSGNYGWRSIRLPQSRDIFFTFTAHLNVTTSIQCRKPHLPNVWGRGMAPVGPPGYATGQIVIDIDALPVGVSQLSLVLHHSRLRIPPNKLDDDRSRAAWSSGESVADADIFRLQRHAYVRR